MTPGALLGLKWGAIGLALVASGIYIDQRARGQVHDHYELERLRQVEIQRDLDIKAQEERTRIDRENFELIVHLQGTAASARASEQRVRNKLRDLSVSCDPATSTGCEAAISLAGILERSIEKYRELGERSGRGFAEGKKCEAYYEEIESK